jgi:hypothetical protein
MQRDALHNSFRVGRRELGFADSAMLGKVRVFQDSCFKTTQAVLILPKSLVIGRWTDNGVCYLLAVSLIRI